MTLAEEQDRAAAARHGGRFLTMKLNEALARDPGSRSHLVRPGVFITTIELREAFTSDPSTAWLVVDGPVTHLSPEPWSTHVGHLRARGWDKTREELLDDATNWPIIRIALGHRVCCGEALAAYSAGCTCGWSHFDTPRRSHFLSPAYAGEDGYPCPVHPPETAR